MTDRVVEPSRTILAVPIIDIAGVKTLIGGTPLVPTTSPAPTSQTSTIPVALLNTWLAVNDNGDTSAGIGGNISCSVLSDLTLGEDPSDTDDERTVCDGAQVSTPTFGNATADLNFLRDADPAANGVFNLSYNLFKAPDIRYAIIDRIQAGTTSTTSFAAGDVFGYYEVTTDNPVDVTDDGGNLKFSQSFSVIDFYMDIEAA